MLLELQQATPTQSVNITTLEKSNKEIASEEKQLLDGIKNSIAKFSSKKNQMDGVIKDIDNALELVRKIVQAIEHDLIIVNAINPTTITMTSAELERYSKGDKKDKSILAVKLMGKEFAYLNKAEESNKSLIFINQYLEKATSAYNTNIEEIKGITLSLQSYKAISSKCIAGVAYYVKHGVDITK